MEKYFTGLLPYFSNNIFNVLKPFGLLSLLLSCQILVGQHKNVKISQINSPEEPTICLNHLNTNMLVAGANVNRYYYSMDGGLSWEQHKLESSYGVAGDPCVISDKFGHFYYLHLSNPQDGSWLDRIVCQKSTDNGISWDDGSFMGYVESKDQDKEWAAVDFKNNFIYCTWTQFDAYGSDREQARSNILFSRSEDNGQSWSDAMQINSEAGDCLDSDNTTEGAVPAVGPQGEIYTAWAWNEKIYFNKSLDQGKTWLENDVEVADQPGGWDFYVPGIYRCNGLPVTCADTSKTVHRGNIYINWTDQQMGSDDTDVWLARSTDGGATWSAPKRVNTDNTHTHQFFSWMTIDQTNGILYFVFYDRRNYSGNETEVFLALSKDGGETFENVKISESPFLPREDVFFGDYTNITAYNNVVRPIWTRLNFANNESGLSVWTALIDTDMLGVSAQEVFAVPEEILYPNPANQLSFYSFKLKRPATVSLILYDAYGKAVKTLIAHKQLVPGKYVESVDLKNEKLMPGLYVYVLRYDKKFTSRKLLVTD